jgi:hypothetical protein
MKTWEPVPRMISSGRLDVLPRRQDPASQEGIPLQAEAQRPEVIGELGRRLARRRPERLWQPENHRERNKRTHGVQEEQPPQDSFPQGGVESVGEADDLCCLVDQDYGECRDQEEGQQENDGPERLVHA